MPDAATLMLMAAAGLCLGAFFFGGLWWTTGRALRSGNPALWVAGSFLVRTGLTLATMYHLSGGRWERLAACLGGFLAARVLATRLSRKWEETHASEPR